MSQCNFLFYQQKKKGYEHKFNGIEIFLFELCKNGEKRLAFHTADISRMCGRHELINFGHMLTFSWVGLLLSSRKCWERKHMQISTLHDGNCACRSEEKEYCSHFQVWHKVGNKPKARVLNEKEINEKVHPTWAALFICIGHWMGCTDWRVRYTCLTRDIMRN